MALRFKQIPLQPGQHGFCNVFQSTDAYDVYFEQDVIYNWLRTEFTPATWRIDGNGLVITVYVTDPTQAVAFRLRWC